MSKRIHELAKECGVQPKDVVAAAEQLGMKGRRSQSTVTDDETGRLKQALGLSPRPAQVTVGAERVVAERMVTQREGGIDRLVTAREQTTETRLQANVIRRRVAREVVRSFRRSVFRQISRRGAQQTLACPYHNGEA